MHWIMVNIKEEKIEIIWDCKKCGLKRSNRLTHKHGLEIGVPIWPGGIR